MRIVSWRRILRIQRRLYTLPWRGDEEISLGRGIPLRGIGYFCAVWLAFQVLGHAPLFGPAVGVFPAPLRWLVLPALLPYLAMTHRLDGISPHAWAWAAVLYGRDVAAERAERQPVRLRGRLRVYWEDTE